ncbi:hypothetical protein [Paraburkholderia sp. BCC1884]|uniref:hypothetical protein n=1 Tax=Paraburkholderia sp. BCC1884 TaxID=2562668 RepID=UPI0011825581|nr:hypothetical protein [Paraburkholderia sp. BCC1884]
MKNKPSRFSLLCLAAATSLVLITLTPPAAASEESADANAETAGERAHFAQMHCDVKPERIGGYKERLRHVLHDASDFDRSWQTGWSRGEKQDMRLDSLRRSDPEEYAARVKASCERLKWLAKNSLRARPPK